MATTSLIIVLFCFVLSATTEDNSGAKAEKNKVMLEKVTRELLLVELDDLKNEILHREVTAKHNNIGKLTGIDKEVNDLLQTRSDAEDKGKTAKKDEIQADQTKKRDVQTANKEKLSQLVKKALKEANQAVDDATEEVKLHKRLMDLSQGRNNVMNSCSDEFGTKFCNNLGKENPRFCTAFKYIASKCRKTCGKCGRFDVYPSFCIKFAGKCHDKNKIGDFLREKCRKTCGAPGVLKNSCTDDKSQAEYCPSWRKKGLCKSEEGVMRKYCKATCDFC